MIASNARAAVAIAVMSPDRSSDMAGSVLLRGGGYAGARPAGDRARESGWRVRNVSPRLRKSKLRKKIKGLAERLQAASST
jgi:hypothetical protein